MENSNANILTKLTDYINKYMILPDRENQAPVLALWAIHTWTFSQAVSPHPRTTPYIYIHSPEKQSGKTRLIDVLEPIVLNPERTVDTSSSVLFRLIESIQPTMMLDEADAIWSGAKNEALRGVLNGGYKPGGHVWRFDGGEPTKFHTFSPKLLAGIDNGLLPDTIRDRCIPIKLQRKRTSESVPEWVEWDYAEEVAQLQAELDAWVRANGSRVNGFIPKRIDGISDRAWEISMPLVAIAETIGKQAGAKARKAIAALLQPEEGLLTPQAQLLLDIREIFGDSERMLTSELIEKLGKGWTPKLLGNKLRPYGVRAGSIRIGNAQGKGFYRSHFEPVWDRYLD